MTTPQDELLGVADQAARAAGAELLRRLGRREGVETKNGLTDLVSAADRAAERVIDEVVSHRRPADGVLGEEGTSRPGSSGLRWVVDPLDGTVNYLLGLPLWCVSIAIEDDQGTLAGVVYDPSRDELFAAERGGPATLDGTPIERTHDGPLAAAPDELAAQVLELIGPGPKARRRAAASPTSLRTASVTEAMRRRGFRSP